jgi:glycosyltransferase involved in cell wall biosynthesis
VTGVVEIAGPRRPRVAFFGYADVFEDFYPHYGVDQAAFANRFAGTGNHAFVSLLQREIADVVWYEFAIRPALEEARHEVVGCRVRMLPSSWAHRLLWRAFYLPKMAWRWRGAYGAYATVASYLGPWSLPFLSALRRDRPDMFFLQDYATGRYDVLLLIAWALGIPVVARHAGSRPEHYVGKLTKRWTIRCADALLVSSRGEAEMLAERFGVPPERMRVVLTPIDTDQFQPIDRARACRLAGLDPARRWLLFVGRLDDRVKRIGALIRAFASVMGAYSDASLAIAGEGPDGAALRELGRSVGADRVRFVGWASGADSLAPVHNAAECLMLPSWREGFPKVAAEAMACGTPVIASRVGGVGELVVNDRTGWMVAAGDDEALCERIAWVLGHPEAVRAMRPAVREYALARVSNPIVADMLRKCFIDAGVRHLPATGDEKGWRS